MATVPNDPHAGALLLTDGAPLEQARMAVLALHGRGASARDILALTKLLELGDDVAVVAPQASGNTWYPYSFLAPLDQNEPYLASAFNLLDTLVTYLADHDIPAERVLLLGFSQGACLASEYAARRARRWGGVAVLTGGLIGPDGTPRDYAGTLDGTPVFLGAGDPDAHVPWTRVEETAAVFARLGAAVTTRRYPGLPHTVNEDEIAAVQALVDSLR
jgi:predicted esterase